MSSSQIFVLLTIIFYLAMMVGIGFLFTKKNNSSDDFYLGGRQLGPFVTAMSAEASDMSGWLLMGLPAVALMSGLPEATWTAVGLAIGTYVNWLIVAKRIRVYTHRLNAFTLPDFFSKRFGDKNHILTIVAAIIIIVFFIPYTASGFAACGKLFGSIFGMDYLTAMILSAIVIMVYCTLGGFLAASTTDFIQSIVMTIALFIVVGFGATVSNGFDTVFANVSQLDGYLNVFQGFNVATGEIASYGLLPVISTLAWGLGYFGMPHILLRFMAIEDENKLSLSRRVASIWVVISMGVAILIGIIGYSLMKIGVVPTYESGSAAETIIVDIAKYISEYSWFAAIIAGIILAGILASTMSTADSQLLAAASGVSQNLVRETFGVKLSEKASVWLARICVTVISVIAIFLAMDPNSSVFRIVSFAWAGFGATFGPVILFSLFWRRTNKWGALAGLISGGVVIFFWKFVIRVSYAGTWLDIYELLPAFIVACIAVVVASLATKEPEKEITDIFDELKVNK